MDAVIRNLLWLTLFLLLALAAGVAWKAWPLLFAQGDLVAQVDPGCDLHSGPCAARLDGLGKVTLSLQPRPLQMLTPLQIEVTLDGVEAQTVEIDFQGVEMFMGYNRRELAGDGVGRYRGEGTLPICVSDGMTWQATVLATTREGLLAAPFQFYIERPR